MSKNNKGISQKKIRQPTVSNPDNVILKKKRRESDFKDNRYISNFPLTLQERRVPVEF